MALRAFSTVLLAGALTLVACSDSVEPGKGSKVFGGDGGLKTCPTEVGDTFQRFPYRPSKPLHGRACSDAQSQGIVTCYLMPDQAQGQQCQQFLKDPQNTACITCAVSTPNDPQLGPLLYSQQSGAAAFNLTGCVGGLTGDATGQGCGGRYAQASQCTSASCECASDKFFGDCVATARQTTCAKYYREAACAAQAIPACEGQGATFWIGPGALTRAYELVKLFCGP